MILTIEEYIQSLRERHIIRPRMTQVLDHITIYTNDLKVYRVLIVARYDATPRQINKAGLIDQYTTIDIDNERIANPETIDISHGKYMLQYDIKTHDIGIYNGEQ